MIDQFSDFSYSENGSVPRVSGGVHLVFFLTFLLILMIETSYRDDLFEASLGFIKKIQEGSSKAGAHIWDVYSNIGLLVAVAGPPFWVLLVSWKRL